MPPVPRRRRPLAAMAAGVVALAAVGAATVSATAATAAPSATGYTVTIGSTGNYPYPTDTPASPFIDKDGTFHFQQSAALYGPDVTLSNPRSWYFFTGTDFDTATPDNALDESADPANSVDKNNDTTWRCNNSQTGLSATPSSGYPENNYCDLVGTWVDPDTGDWYGLVHNEFTGNPFGDPLHYDAIDYAKSTDQGHTWTIEGHAITSPYSTTRNDTTAFPNQTYDYGDGDPRLFVDTASGYFYVYYGSRIVNKPNTGGKENDGLAHVARAPISGKMASGTWQKWYNGTWTQPGVGGQESNMVPVDGTNYNGYTPPSSDYNPALAGTVEQQVANGTMPSKSPLFIMNISYDAYLGLYVGEPEEPNVDVSLPQQFYVTDSLATQKWHLAGDSGSLAAIPYYHWMVDSANLTSSTIIGKTFRSYCSIGCYNSQSGSTVDVTLDSVAPAGPAFVRGTTYQIANENGRVLAQVSGGTATTSLAAGTGSDLEGWSFTGLGDGSYQIANAATGQLLGVDSSTTAGRAWGAALTATPVPAGGPNLGQQWFVIPGATGDGTYHLVNRYSGLTIGMSKDTSRLSETTPVRSWTDTTGSSVGGKRTPGEQTLTVMPVGTVHLVNPGNQTGELGAPVSIQLNATETGGQPVTFSATGLPAGVSMSSTGLVSGTPTSTTFSPAAVTVTATAGTASASVSFTWAVNRTMNATSSLSTGGMSLTDPGLGYTSEVQLTTGHPDASADQLWKFTQQSDGSYELRIGSNMCATVQNTAAGTAVNQFQCSVDSNNNLSAYQRWFLTPLPNGLYTITSVRSGLLLTTSSSADGATVTQEPNTNSPQQQWNLPTVNIKLDSILSGVHTLTASGMALDDPAGSTTAGTQLTTSTPTQGADQDWQLISQTDGTYELANSVSGLCATVDNAFLSVGTAILQQPCDGSPQQDWMATTQTNGTYTLTPDSNGNGLSLATASAADGALVTQQPPAPSSAFQQWTIGTANPVPGGTHTLSAAGLALTDPGGAYTALATGAGNGGPDRNWQFLQQSDGSYELVNSTSSLCATVNNGSSDAGAVVNQYQCNGSTNQTWTLTQLPSGSYTVTSVRSGLVLTTSADGTTVTQQPNEGSPQQQWTIGFPSPVPSGRSLTSGALALDNPGGGQTPNTALTAVNATGGAERSWQFVLQSDGSYELVNGASGLCVTVNNGSVDPNAVINQYQCKSAGNQRWTLTPLANGSYTVTSVRSGLALTTSTDGTTVTQQPNTGSPQQQWRIA
jgi:hypothetical protein